MSFRIMKQVMSSSEAELIGMVVAAIKSTTLNGVMLQFSTKPKDILYTPKQGDPLRNIEVMDIFGDCKPAIQSTKSLNPGKMITNIGHLDYRLYKIRELTSRGAVRFQHIAGDGNPADLMTKLVPKGKFTQFTDFLLNTKADSGFQSAIGN